MTTAPSFALQRIILIDSYRQNSIEEIRVAEHAAITGENGSGKTTLLRVLPVFFGELPNKVVRRDGDQEGFVRHYLPRPTSYIVFEYRRHESLLLAVVHSGGNADTASYQFIDSPYRREFFVLDDGFFVTAGRQLRQHVESLSVTVTSPMGNEAYRQVIQNDPTRETSQLAAHYSFANKGRRLQHLEKVLTAVLQRETTFFDLKRMVIASVRKSDAAFKLQLDRDAFRRWVSESEAYRTIMALKPRMVAIGETNQARKQAAAAMAELHGEFLSLRQHLSTASARYVQLLGEAKEAHGERGQHHDVEQLRLKARKADADAAAGAAQRAAENLMNERTAYDKAGVDDKARQVATLQDLSDRAETARKRLGEVMSAQKPIIDMFDDMEFDLIDQAASARATVEPRRAAAANAHTEANSAANAGYDSARMEAEEAHGQRMETLDSAFEEAVARHAEAVALAQQAGADPALVTAYESAQADETTARDAEHAAREALDEAKRAHRESVAEFTVAQQQLLQCGQQVGAIETDIAYWAGLQTPGEGTLLHFMRLNVPGWEQQIGRVVNPDLLLRNDLAPAIASNHSETLYGVTIDLDRISMEGHADEADIARRLEELVGRLKTAQGALAAARAGEASAKGIAADRERALSTAGALHAAARTQMGKASTTVKEIREAVAASLKKARADATALAGIMAQRRQGAESARSSAKKVFDQTRKSLADARDARLRENERVHKAAIAQITADLDVIDQDFFARRETLKLQRESALAEKGVSATTLSALDKEVNDADARVKQVRGYVEEVERYRAWAAHSWPQHAEHKAEAARQKAISRQVQDELKALEAQFASYLDSYRQRLQQLDDQLSAAQRDLAAVDIHLEALELWPFREELPAWSPAMMVGPMARRREETQQRLRAAEADIRRGIGEIRGAMVQFPCTAVEQFHQGLVGEHGLPRDGAEHEWITHLLQWFIDRHSETFNHLLQEGKTLALQVDDFRKDLESFDSDVANFSGQLSASLRNIVKFRKIHDVSVNIRVGLAEQDYWGVVQGLSDAYRKWGGRETLELPDSEFIDAAKKLSNKLQEVRGLATNPADLIDLTIEASIADRSKRVVAKNEHQLTNMSSTGLSYLILCVVMIGFLKRIVRDDPIQLTWGVDELRDLDGPNTRTLMGILDDNGITLATAFPDPDADVFALFPNRYIIRGNRRVHQIELEADHV